MRCCLLACGSYIWWKTFRSYRIVSYRIAIFCVISYRIESCPLWLYRAITTSLFILIVLGLKIVWANLPNRYIALCWRPVMHAQTWASYSALYRFGRLSIVCSILLDVCSLYSEFNHCLVLQCFVVITAKLGELWSKTYSSCSWVLLL